ncbi:MULTISPECIES: sulfite exporter TauE/SafE family protein [unclassified Streptomyces]|uniref:HoxN/HupN/NixA family nickel/cobalt transporter n=1 Tax=unclassified Streptomyces TaxID=2593676 RepID=UPI000F70EE70|nr:MULTISPECIES: sulfite exporter TauE/SafE family protein [unclassified Streptomyces]AZM63135.1 nickel transporter [Streptomyces sp. WAC 01438]RSN00583.1 nickel transporter [Streptomyces sp. WAC 01420]
MNLLRRPAAGAAVLTAACALVLAPATTASAHPLGNFTVNRYDGLVAAPGELRVRHVEDLAEIPATQAGPDIDRLGRDRWARERCAAAARDSEVRVGGRAAPLTVRDARARVRPGQAGLDTLRVECGLTAPLPDGETVDVRFRGAGAASGPGWREITARGDRMTLTASDVPASSLSRELTRYPEELLSSPADSRTATLRVRPGGPALTGGKTDAPASAVLPRGADRFTRALDELVARRDLTAGFAALALLIAVGLGAMHALAPGHGKTLMAATAAARGGRARLRDVLPMAASVTVTHTLGVVALGLLVTAGSAAAPSVIAWLGVASGVLVTLAGASLVRRALRGRGHGHVHPHAYDHEHAHPHAHEHALGHDHDHSHTHNHTHNHEQPHGHVEHTHGGRTHTHPTAPTLRGTILLGFAGGLVPSPSAVVVLVGAAALGQAWFGLLLVVAYGVGLALTLTAAGYAVVKAGSGVTRLLDRRPRWTSAPWAALVRRSAPLGSAFVVLALGAGLVFRGAASALG